MWKRAKESSLTYDGARPCPKPLFAGTMHFAGPKKNARLAESLDEPPTSPEPPQQATLLASGNLHLASLLLQPGYPSEDIMASGPLRESQIYFKNATKQTASHCTLCHRSSFNP